MTQIISQTKEQVNDENREYCWRKTKGEKEEEKKNKISILKDKIISKIMKIESTIGVLDSLFFNIKKEGKKEEEEYDLYFKERCSLKLCVI